MILSLLPMVKFEQRNYKCMVDDNRDEADIECACVDRLVLSKSEAHDSVILSQPHPETTRMFQSDPISSLHNGFPNYLVLESLDVRVEHSSENCMIAILEGRKDNRHPLPSSPSTTGSLSIEKPHASSQVIAYSSRSPLDDRVSFVHESVILPPDSDGHIQASSWVDQWFGLHRRLLSKERSASLSIICFPTTADLQTGFPFEFMV